MAAGACLLFAAGSPGSSPGTRMLPRPGALVVPGRAVPGQALPLGLGEPGEGRAGLVPPRGAARPGAAIGWSPVIFRI